MGRLIADKAADLLWEALPEILRSGDVEVTVLGSGPYQAKFAAARWPGYRYLEYVSGRQQLAEIYRQHDILLAPGPYETFGLAVLEAMASGLVVVGPDRGGTAELLAEAHSPFVFGRRPGRFCPRGARPPRPIWRRIAARRWPPPRVMGPGTRRSAA